MIQSQAPAVHWRPEYGRRRPRPTAKARSTGLARMITSTAEATVESARRGAARSPHWRVRHIAPIRHIEHHGNAKSTSRSQERRGAGSDGTMIRSFDRMTRRLLRTWSSRVVIGGSPCGCHCLCFDSHALSAPRPGAFSLPRLLSDPSAAVRSLRQVLRSNRGVPRCTSGCTPTQKRRVRLSSIAVPPGHRPPRKRRHAPKFMTATTACTVSDGVAVQPAVDAERTLHGG
jgi:hypothetical protein